MSQDLDLGYVLAVARRSLSEVSNFRYGDFVQSILRELVAHQVIEPPPPPFNSYHDLHLTLRQKNAKLEQLIIEAFFYMFHRGYFVPESNAPNAPALNILYVTDKGSAWLSGNDPMPEDARGYMQMLKSAVPKLDHVVRQYVEEALITYERQAWFASAVMLGAAAEKTVYLLAEALQHAAQDTTEKKRISTAIRERKLPTLFETITASFEKARKKIPYELQEGLTQHLISFFEAIRVQRNEAVHPAVAAVSPEQVRMTLAAFPQALSIAFGLLDWLSQNPI